MEYADNSKRWGNSSFYFKCKAELLIWWNLWGCCKCIS